MNLVLASTSVYRKELLNRLGLPFTAAAPDIDESRNTGESPEQLVSRLAEAKARAAVSQLSDALIIGSDQVAACGDQILGKPGNFERAFAQLKLVSGKRLQFLTGLYLLNTNTGIAQVEVVPFSVIFKRLSNEQIENYLHREEPYHCTGSFKSEGLGIALCEAFEGNDPTALIGLPLIRLTHLLEKQGVNII